LINILSSKFVKVILFFLLLFSFNAYSEEPAPDRCFDDFLKAINNEEIKGKQNISYIIKETDDDPLKLLTYEYDEKFKKFDATKFKSFYVSLSNCINISADQFAIKYKEQIKSLIEEDNDLFNPEKVTIKDGKWLFSTKKIESNIDGIVDSKLVNAEKDKIEEPKEEVIIELINFDEALNETIKVIINFYDVWIDKILAEEFRAEQSPEKITDLITQEWKKIKDDRCIVKNNPEEQLNKCNDKLERIKKFKKEKLKNLKYIQTFNLNYAEIKKCIKDGEIIDDLCVSKKEKLDDLDQMIEVQLITDDQTDNDRRKLIFQGLKDFNFSYDVFLEEIDNYLNNELIRDGINEAKEDIEAAKKAEQERKDEEERERKNNEEKERKENFLDKIREDLEFESFDIPNNIEKETSEFLDLDIENIDDLNAFSSIENEINSLINKLENSINTIDTKELSDQKEKSQKIKNYDQYKNSKEVKNLLSNIDEEIQKRNDYKDQLNSYVVKLQNKINSFESKKESLQIEMERTNFEEQLSILNEEKNALEESLLKEKKWFWISSFLIICTVLMGGVIAYVWNRQYSKADHTLRSSFTDQYKLLHDENKNLKKQIELLKAKISSNKAADNINQTAQRTFKSRFEEEVETPQTKINPITEMIQNYEIVIKNPNKIDDFINTYNVITLDRQSRVLTQGETILVKDTRGPLKANFWLISIENQKILLPGRTLSVNVSSLTADNYRYARDLLGGIFSYRLGNEFKLIKYGLIDHNGDLFKVLEDGIIELPQK
jgi:hypothetical protein